VHDLIPKGTRLPQAKVPNRALRQAHRVAARLRDGSYWLRWLSARLGGISIAVLCVGLVLASLFAATTVTTIAWEARARLLFAPPLVALLAWGFAYKMTVGLLPFAWDSLKMAMGTRVDLLDPDHAPIHDARMRIVQINGRRAGVVEIIIDTAALSPGDQVEVALALHEDSTEGPILADHPSFRGPGGVFVARELSAPIGADDSMDMTMSVVFPLRALVIPKDANRLRGTGTIQLAVGERAAGTFSFEWEIAVIEADRQTMQVRRPRLPAQAATAEEMAVVAQETAAGQCMVCGDELGDGDVPVCCDVCDTPHHEECWEYVGKCTTYACGGAARRMAPGPAPDAVN
jgi:hypothetical protein